MDRRRFLASLASTGLAARAQAQTRRRPPNLIFILADDLGYGELGCYGQRKIATPHIDRLAAEGLRFTDAYAGAAVCAPSRSALMSGQHTGHSPVRANGGANPLQPGDTTVAEALRPAGYRSGCFGKWGLGDIGTTGVPWEQGFDEFFGYLHQVHAHFFYPEYLYRNGQRVPLAGNDRRKAGGVYSADVIHQQALDFLRKGAEGAAPLFLYLAYTLPHGEYQVPADSVAPYAGQFEEEPIEARGEHDAQPTPYAAYAGMISRLDAQVGEVMDLVDELGVAEETLIIFTSDNGPSPPHGNLELFDSNGPLRGRKGQLYEGGIRVPFIARWRGRIEPGTETDFPTAFWDFLPTACDLAGVEPPEDVDGVSIRPVLFGEGRPEREYLYWEHPGSKLERHYRAARWGPWKAIRDGADAELELYHLERDLGETANVAAQHPEIVERMAAILDRAHREPRPHFRKWWP